MSFIHFVKAHIEEIRNYVQPAIRWREGHLAPSVAKAEATGGDFAEVIRSLPAELRREDVVAYFKEDLYKGFVASVLWGGISRFHPEEMARCNDRSSVVPKLERLKTMLRKSRYSSGIILDAIDSMQRGEVNNFYGIGPSFFTKILHFLSADLALVTRPLIYDENMKQIHFALSPDVGLNPFFHYIPIGRRMSFAEGTYFEDVYLPYCEMMCRVAEDLDVDVTNLESWLFGWPLNIRTDRPNPREIAWREIRRMDKTGMISFIGGISYLFDAIGVARIFHDNRVITKDLLTVDPQIGTDKDHPIVINESDDYAHLALRTAEAMMNYKRPRDKRKDSSSIHILEQKDQLLVQADGRILERLCLKVQFADETPAEVEWYFDVTAGCKASQEGLQ